MSDSLYLLYPWVKALHIVSAISWMAGLLYLPRLFVYHVQETGQQASANELFCKMEYRLLKIIMTPAMLLTWLFGLVLIGMPGLVDWTAGWPWIKIASVIAMTAFHFFLAMKHRELREGHCRTSQRQFRWMNEIPTVLMIVIVVFVVVKPF